MDDMEPFLFEALTQTHIDTKFTTHRSRLFRMVIGPQSTLKCHCSNMADTEDVFQLNP